RVRRRDGRVLARAHPARGHVLVLRRRERRARGVVHLVVRRAVPTRDAALGEALRDARLPRLVPLPERRLPRRRDRPAPAVVTPLDAAVRDFLAHLVVERGVSSNTSSAYRRDLARYTEFLALRGLPDLAAVRESDIGDFVTALSTGEATGAAMSAASVARAVAAVRGLHRFALLEGKVSVDAAAGLRAPTRPKRLPKAISVDEVTRLLDAAGLGDGPIPLRDRAILELLYSTGARISEVTGLDVDDVD